MTKLLDQAIDLARRLPANDQDAVARLILGAYDEEAEQAIPPEDRAAVLEGLAQVERGEFATDEEVEEAFRAFRK